LPVHVWFEDTDFSGVVYHANYLRFMERGRSAMLADAGIDQRAMFESGRGYYVVRDMAIDWLAPARFQDDLIVETRVTALGAATVAMAQAVIRDGTVLARATMRAAYLSAGGRPQRQPAFWAERFAALLAASPAP
jgi:acyl-CoA thioester hydrolase